MRKQLIVGMAASACLLALAAAASAQSGPFAFSGSETRAVGQAYSDGAPPYWNYMPSRAGQLTPRSTPTIVNRVGPAR